MTNLQYTIRKTTEDEKLSSMPYLTNSMVEAVNTCPRWGIVHNVLGKHFTSNYRQMALEAGSLMHECFSVLNLLHIGVFRNLPDHMHYHGAQLFNKQRWEYIYNEGVKKSPTITKDSKNVFERMLFATIGSSDYHDDPYDRNRTVANLEHCALELLNYWMMNLVVYPIYVSDTTDCTKPIGIEMSLDVVFEIEHDVVVKNKVSKTDTVTSIEKKSQLLRCIGLADVVYYNENKKQISLGEYKTASSMSDGWREAFNTRHQITLYNAALQAYFSRQEKFNTIVIGSSIPVRGTSLPVQHFTIPRDQENIQELLKTFIFTEKLINDYKHVPTTTPMFTHSCNRYFRPCSLLDFCTATSEDKQTMIEQMETIIASSPSEVKALLRNG